MKARFRNVDAIIPQLQGLIDLFAHACADPKFHGPVELKRLEQSFSGQVVSPSPGKPVPDLPRDGFLARTVQFDKADEGESQGQVCQTTERLRRVPRTLRSRSNGFDGGTGSRGNY